MKCPECLHDTVFLALDLVAKVNRYTCVKCRWRHKLSISKDEIAHLGVYAYHAKLGELEADVDRERQQATATLFGE